VFFLEVLKKKKKKKKKKLPTPSGESACTKAHFRTNMKIENKLIVLLTVKTVVDVSNILSYF